MRVAAFSGYLINNQPRFVYETHNFIAVEHAGTGELLG